MKSVSQAMRQPEVGPDFSPAGRKPINSFLLRYWKKPLLARVLELLAVCLNNTLPAGERPSSAQVATMPTGFRLAWWAFSHCFARAFYPAQKSALSALNLSLETFLFLQKAAKGLTVARFRLIFAST
jgi:hypothetical protein